MVELVDNLRAETQCSRHLPSIAPRARPGVSDVRTTCVEKEMTGSGFPNVLHKQFLEARLGRGVTELGFPRVTFEGVLIDVKRFDFGFQGGGLESEFDRSP